MSITSLQEQAWKSGLVLLDETGEWNETDWPPLKGGWREFPASVVLNHAEQDNSRGQTVVVMGGDDNNFNTTNSVLVLNLVQADKQWREGPPMNKSRKEHAAVVCNGGVYVMGGYNGRTLDCIERIDVNDLLQSSLTTSNSKKSQWTPLSCRLSITRCGCCAVAVHNRYIVVMGGWAMGQDVSSVDVIDTSNHTVIVGPSMNVPRSYFGSAVIGHRIFVIGGCRTNTSVEYLDFTKACDKEERNADTLSTVISFSAAWTTHSSLALSVPHYHCAMVAVGSCLVVAGGRDNPTVQVMDTHRNCVWNLPSIGRNQDDFSMVTVANQVAVIGGWSNPSCATLKIMDKNAWCFRKLCDQAPNGWYHFGKDPGRIE